MSSCCNKKSVLRTVFTANGSCGCAKTKAIEVHEPTPKAKFTSNTINHQKITKLGSSSKASSTTTSGERNGAVSIDEDGEEFSSTTVSEAETITTTTSYYASKRSPLINSVAVEKDSEDPYHDFRHSMLQMIFEKEIDSEEDLQELLQCFLHLNATCYHRVIVKAFNEICQEAFPHNDNNKVSAATALPSASSNTSHDIIRKK